MSAVIITVKKKDNGFSDIYIDGKLIGTLEDVGDVDSIYDVLKLIFKHLDVNVEVERK